MESLASSKKELESQFSSYKITLCICTMNRPDDLNRCLDSIFKGSDLPDEIIVSDDSSEPEPTKKIAKIYPSATYQRGPRQGLGPNRNACIRSAQGTHILFIDDDVHVSSDFFSTARKLIAEDPESVITGHEIKYRSWEDTNRKIIPHNADFWGTMRIPVGNSDCCSVVMNATVFPTKLFEVALFDECLRYGYEELDIARHAVSLGYQILRKDCLWVNHHQSLIDRESNWKFKYSSQMYTTAKAYFYYDRSILKTLAYAILAPLKITGSLIKRREPAALRKGTQSTIMAYQHFFSKKEKGLSIKDSISRI